MDPLSTTLPISSVPTSEPAGTRRRPVLPRWLALAQAVAICGLPTQLVVTILLIAFTSLPVMSGSGTPTLEFFAMLSLLDTALVALLIRVFLMLSGETSRDVFLGQRRVAGEIWRGLALVPLLLVAVVGIVRGLRFFWPSLQTVGVNPLAEYMATPLEAAIFIVVVVLAGGVREELQRAFILHRAEQRLGGAWVGLFTFGVLFGVLHVYQGVDLAIAIGLQGLVWGVLYIMRGSVVMSLVSHAGFNAAQVVLAVYAKSLAV